MTDVDSSSDILDGDSDPPQPGPKRRNFKRFSRISRAGSIHEPAEAATGMSEVEPAPNGEPPPGAKQKHRVKLWDSFLQKTRKIRVRTKDKTPGSSAKLQKRASSHPNISSFSSAPSSPEDTNKTFIIPNGTDDSLEQTDCDTALSKRDKYRQQRDSTFIRSSVSLNGSSSDNHTPGDKFNNRDNTRDSDITGDDGYRSSHDHSTSTTEAYSPRTPEVLSRKDSTERNSSFDNCEDNYADVKTVDVRDEDEDREDDNEGDHVRLVEKDSLQTLNAYSSRSSWSNSEDVDLDQGGIDMAESTKPHQKSYIPFFLLRRAQRAGKGGRKSKVSRAAELRQTDVVSKSVDSLLAVASSISLPPNATVRAGLRPERHSLQQFGSETSIGSSASGARIRRHSYCYTISDKSEDSTEFFDCWDGVSDGDVTSSSQEPSPIRFPRGTQSDSSESRGRRLDRLFKRQSTLSSLGMSAGFASDRDSADSDIDERSSNVLDLDTSVVIESEEDSSSFSESPTITVHTSLAQEPSLSAVSQQLLQQHSFYTLHVHLREGRGLVIRDSCGTSDPYVKFKVGNKVFYKSRTIYKNLNPRWNEKFTIPVDDITKPVLIKVFDYDRAWNDDPMGGAELDLSTLEINKETDMKLLLSEKGKEEYMGYLLLTCTLVPKADDEKEQVYRRSGRVPEVSRKSKMQPWNGVVNIVLVEGSNLVSMDDNGFSDPYVKFRLGLEKYRSKVKSKTLNPCWLEQFDLRLYEDQTSQLEITVFDHDTRGKDDFMGRAVIDLSQLEKEKTRVIEQQLEDGAGTIKLLLTVTGTVGSEIPSDLANYTPNALDKDSVVSRYGLLNSFTSLNDVGHLEVKVFRAHGLQAADFGGLSDPFCVLELVNDRVQTHTEYKTLNPEWGKVFTFQIKDIHSVLEITVFDEDRNKKVEFLGKVAIPLLRIKNGERRWYALKDRKMVHKSKGAILLEMDLVFNHIKAGIRTVNPREEKLIVPEQKFKISTMKHNINRMSQLIGVFIDTGRFVQSCFDWQSPPRTITAFIVYLLIVWNFELYMLPISLLLIFLKNLIVAQIIGSLKKEPVEDDYFMDEEDDEDEEKDKQEEKKSIVDRYHAVQEVCLTVQQYLDTVASLGERVKNTFNWSVPWLSTLAVVALLTGCVVLFYIPLRYLLLAWGINKFTKKLRKPDAISNNELLDFLSRVPSDDELLQYKELRPDIPANTVSTKKKRL